MSHDVKECPCGKRFRPQFFMQKRCMDCVNAFATSSADADEYEGVKPLPLRKVTGHLIIWPTPPGVCAYDRCRRSFDGYPNQRYCCVAHRFQAVEERRQLRNLAREEVSA